MSAYDPSYVERLAGQLVHAVEPDSPLAGQLQDVDPAPALVRLRRQGAWERWKVTGQWAGAPKDIGTLVRTDLRPASVRADPPEPSWW